MKPEELERYARHIVLREIGGPGQNKLRQAKVLMIGAGGLGSPALMYLAAAGVGVLGIVDDDTVSLSNLQRQVLHKTKSIGDPKVQSAQSTISEINPHISVRPHPIRLNNKNAKKIIGDYDIVLDGSDNFNTRYLINETCVTLNKPLVSAAMSQWEGQISIYNPTNGSPCYACVFPEAPATGLAPSCAEAGVMGALPGVMGSMMAIETIKYITKAGEPLVGNILIYDALYGETRKMRIAKNTNCKICGAA